MYVDVCVIFVCCLYIVLVLGHQNFVLFYCNIQVNNTDDALCCLQVYVLVCGFLKSIVLNVLHKSKHYKRYQTSILTYVCYCCCCCLACKSNYYFLFVFKCLILTFYSKISVLTQYVCI